MILGPILLTSILFLLTIATGYLWLNSRGKGPRKSDGKTYQFRWIPKPDGVFDGHWEWKGKRHYCQILPLIDAESLLSLDRTKAYAGVLVKVETLTGTENVLASLEQFFDSFEVWDENTVVFKKSGIPFRKENLSSLMKALNDHLSQIKRVHQTNDQ